MNREVIFSIGDNIFTVFKKACKLQLNMTAYYVNRNAQDNGDHEVHETGCKYFPHSENAEYLGDYKSCESAVLEAKIRGYKANGCFYCSKDCHTS